jgi:hypothetical protein
MLEVMPKYRIQKEYTNWEEIEIKASSEEEALEIAESNWEDHYPLTVDAFNYTGKIEIYEVASSKKKSKS